jgi:hypothetical protein
MLGERSRAVATTVTHDWIGLPVAERRDRTDFDPDLEFDFFEDAPTRERSVRERVAPPKRAGRPPMRPRAPGGTPVVRLGALIGGAIVLAVIIVLWVTSCGGGGARGSYEDYMSEVRSVVGESNEIGRQLAQVITQRGTTLEQIDTRLNGLAQRQEQVATRATGLEPPGSLISEQESLVEAMQFLASGLLGLQQAAAQVQLATPPEEAGATLAQQAARLVAGQVVYDDGFRARSQEVMRSEGVAGIAVPELTFLSSPDLVSQTNLTSFMERLLGGAGAGGEAPPGLHGNGIEAVRVEPGDQTLSPTDENTITASENLAFLVSVKNSGEFQETQVKVNLVIQFSGEPIRKSQTIELINPEETKTVRFTDFGDLVFAEPTTLRVSVEPVPGEENRQNNTAEFPVIFTFE